MSQEPPPDSPPAGAPDDDAPVPTPVPTPGEIHEELEAAAAEAAEPDERRYPSTIGGAFYLLVLAVGGVGIAVVWGGDWRLGIRCLAAGLCFAALLRLVLPGRDAGMLAVRNRFLDAVVLGGLGAALFFLAQTIPNQPG
ncbi:DUF3017 domain-containing protein [Nocardioides anomalus]|uniref:DUF3017 domain-containing protein n=1 Tax=Nocardioides anomalus TaxID=2712223 RepID=UPI001E4BBCD0|nr:DUF3017 domain-containing protein [Nocardioides anomalus]